MSIRRRAVWTLGMAILAVGCACVSANAKGDQTPSLHNYMRYIAQAPYFSKYDVVSGPYEINTDKDGLILDLGRNAGMYHCLAVAAQAGRSIDDEIQWTLKNGTASGKIYAALLLRRYDDRRATDEFKLLQQTISDPNRTLKAALDGTLAWTNDYKIALNEWRLPEVKLDSLFLKMAYVDEVWISRKYGGQTPELYAVFAQAQTQNNRVVEQLEWIVAHGTPAGRLTAARCLKALDDEKGRAAFASLLSCDDKVRIHSGCLHPMERISDLAQSGLDGELRFQWRSIVDELESQDPSPF